MFFKWINFNIKALMVYDAPNVQKLCEKLIITVGNNFSGPFLFPKIRVV
jgi:hypothetical protein